MKYNQHIDVLFKSNDILLDITGDQTSLIIIYKNEYNDIYLRNINKKTLDIQNKFLLDNIKEFNRKSF